MVNVIKMKPRYRAALLIVGLYCVLLYFRGRFEYLFLIYGLMIVYGYTGGTENDMTLAAWEEVSIIKANIYKYKYNVLSNRLCSICLRQSRETNGLRSALRKKDLC